MHRFFNTPMKSCNPPMAKTMKKKTSTIMESTRSLRAENKDSRMTFSALILEIVLRGLSTLRTLREEREPPDPPPVR